MTIRPSMAVLLGGALTLALVAAGAYPSSAGANAALRAPTGAASPAPSGAPRGDADLVTVTVTGEITTATASGEDGYRISAAGQTTRLSTGPRWFYDTEPLAQFVGKTVTVTGERSSGAPSANASARAKGKPDEGPEIDVFTISGEGTTVTIRGAGKPPWAGGPKAIGTKHPGWKTSKIK